MTQRVRVIRTLRTQEGMEAEFLQAYQGVLECAQRSAGHVNEQLCRSVDDPDQWLLTSEWTSFESLGEWRNHPDHKTRVKAMNACLLDERWTGVFHIVSGHQEARRPAG